MNKEKLFDESLIDELNDLKENGGKAANQPEPRTDSASTESLPLSEPESKEAKAEVNDNAAGQGEKAGKNAAESAAFSPETTEAGHAVRKAVPDREKEEQPVETETDHGENADKKLFIIRIAAVAVAVLGLVMLVSGMVLRRLDEESRKTPEKAQMPEEYIEEFFSDENFRPDIEKYIEPEA